MITDIKKALRLLDVIYTSDNDSIKESYDKLAVLASLDQTPGRQGPFELFYNEYQGIKWQVEEVRSKVYTLEQYNNNPSTNYVYQNWLNNHIDARIMSKVSESYSVRALQDRVMVLEHELQKLKQEENEQEPNSDTE